MKPNSAMMLTKLRKLSTFLGLVGKQIIIAVEEQHNGSVYEQYITVVVTSVIVTNCILQLSFNLVEIRTELAEKDSIISSVVIGEEYCSIDVKGGTLATVYTMQYEPILLS